MGSTVKMDQRAFNRGVDEVLKFKPLVRVVKDVARSVSKNEPSKTERSVAPKNHDKAPG